MVLLAFLFSSFLFALARRLASLSQERAGSSCVPFTASQAGIFAALLRRYCYACYPAARSVGEFDLPAHDASNRMAPEESVYYTQGRVQLDEAMSSCGGRYCVLKACWTLLTGMI